jgi:hypothetical protein
MPIVRAHRAANVRAMLLPLPLVALAFAAPTAGADSAGADAAQAPIPIVAPVARAAGVTGVVDVDADAVDKNGEPAVTFKLGGVLAKELRGKRITWTLYVKRKLGAWTTARNYPLGETYVAAHMQELPAVAGTFLYATLAKDRFLPGEHEAAIVGTVDQGKTEVFRGDAAFVLKATKFTPLRRSLR